MPGAVERLCNSPTVRRAAAYSLVAAAVFGAIDRLREVRDGLDGAILVAARLITGDATGDDTGDAG